MQPYAVSDLPICEINAGFTERTEDFHRQAEFYPRAEEGIALALPHRTQLLADHTDAEGYLTLQMEYWVYTFQDGEIDYSQHTDGTATFKVKVK